MTIQLTEQNRNRNRRYYQEHRTEILERMRKFRETHKEEIAQRPKPDRRDYGQRYYQEHKLEIKERHRNYEHKEETIQRLKVYRKNYREKNLEKARTRSRTSTRQWQDTWREKVWVLLGICCIQCGFSDKRALQIDHINGGGRRESKGGKVAMYKKIVKAGGAGYQILCANCNSIKRVENKECSQRKR